MTKIIDVYGVPVYNTKIINKHIIDEHLTEEMVLSDVQDVSDVDVEEWDCTVQTSYHLESEWKWNFFNTILPDIDSYIEHLNPEQPVIANPINIWGNNYRNGDHQELHQHFDNRTNFSFSYNFKVPTDKSLRSKFIFRETSRAPYESRFGWFGKKFRSRFVPPNQEEGDILIFPSWLWHMVSPNRTDENRITISGNLAIYPENQ